MQTAQLLGDLLVRVMKVLQMGHVLEHPRQVQQMAGLLGLWLGSMWGLL